jgi:zinc transport system permease protein
MRTVGLLLISALMVVPVVAAQQITRGFRSTMTVAVVIGVVAAASGVTLSGEIDTAPGATIVILAIGAFVVLAAVSTIRRTRRPAPVPIDAEPPDLVLHG